MEATIGKLVDTSRWIKDAWLLVGVAVLLFCFLEGSLSLALFIKGRIAGSEPAHDWRVRADAYSDRSWVSGYYREFRSSDAVYWRPYVYWRRGPYQGKYINVDSSGLRRTTAPQPQGAGRPLKIFMFGGSALWGTGARDAFTIPSILVRELHNRGLHADVVNFGESGYVSTQEVVALLLRLQRGDRPDVVIFYDGVNDTYSAYQQHAAGWPQNEFNRVKEFNLSADLPRMRAMALRELTTRLATVRALGALLRSAGIRSTVDSGAASGRRASGEDVVAAYSGNLGLLKALSEHYHFKCLSYWQPTIFQKVSLTGYERAERQKAQPFEQFFTATYSLVRGGRLPQSSEPLFHDLSLVFSDVRQPVFLDWVHIGEWGNEVIARQMATDVIGVLAPGRARASSSRLSAH